MSVSKWRWTEVCDGQACPGDCDECDFWPDEEEEEEYDPEEEYRDDWTDDLPDAYYEKWKCHDEAHGIEHNWN